MGVSSCTASSSLTCPMVLEMAPWKNLQIIADGRRRPFLPRTRRPAPRFWLYASTSAERVTELSSTCAERSQIESKAQQTGLKALQGARADTSRTLLRLTLLQFSPDRSWLGSKPSFTPSHTRMSSTHCDDALSLPKLAAPTRSLMKAPNSESTKVDPHGPPDGRHISSSCIRGCFSTTRCIVMSTVPPPQSSTMNRWPSRSASFSASQATQAASGSRASASRSELSS